MTDNDKKPGVAFWATVVVTVLVVVYPLSVGPVVWLEARGLMPQPLEELIDWFYAPMEWVYMNCPHPVPDVIDWYAGLWDGGRG